MAVSVPSNVSRAHPIEGYTSCILDPWSKEPSVRIAQVAPLWEAVPPVGYGGTERVVSYLTEELVRRGHDVTLFATGDSWTTAKLVPIVAQGLRLTEASPDAATAEHVRMLGRVFGSADRFDVIHCHVDYWAFPFSHLVRTPTVHTIHGRLDLPYLQTVYRELGRVPLVSISHAQRAPLAAARPSWVATVHHGIPLRDVECSTTHGRYLAFLGRISPEKGPDVAIDLAVRTGVPLTIAAKVDPVDREYFERAIAPRLDHPLITFLGEVNGDEKFALLRNARALLFPIDWPEPFGLVMLEAMACGTPVVARRMGSTPEVIAHGRTGFLADTGSALVEAVRRIEDIDRAECRQHVEQHFSVERMVDDYETVYRRLLTRAAAA
jgi:glycosyltransferase involved in cell wall biosynthesis